MPFTEQSRYDIKGRQTLHVSFEGVVTRFQYDDTPQGNGRLIEKQFFDNLTQYNAGIGAPSERQTFTYDAFGRMISTVWDRDLSAPGTDVQTWTNSYDTQGRLTDVTSPTGEIHYEYDVFGRRVRVASRSAGFQPVNSTDYENDMRYAYDAQGRLIRVETIERHDIIVDVDGNGAVIPAQAGIQPETESYAYTLLGNLDYEINPDGSVTDYTYDELNRLTDIDEYRRDPNDGPGSPNVGPGSPDPAPAFTDNPKLSQHSYTLRADGKRASADEIIYKDDGSVFSHTEYDWTYDNAGRLTDEIFTDVGNLLTNVDDYHAEYTYDLTGNRVEKSVITDTNHDGTFSAATDRDSVTQYTQDANDRMLSESTVVDGSATESTVYGYTGTQQTSKTVTDNTTSSVTSALNYTYDLQGRMSRAVTVAGNRTSDVSYLYGTDGIRISAREDVNENGSTSTRITSYLIDAQNQRFYVLPPSAFFLPIRSAASVASPSGNRH